jgi:hypothetical protein
MQCPSARARVAGAAAPVTAQWKPRTKSNRSLPLTSLAVGRSGLGERYTTPQHICCITQHMCCMLATVTSAEFKRWLHGQGCAFEPGTGLVSAIRRDLRLE